MVAIARLSRRFTRRFSLYRVAQRHVLSPARTAPLLSQVARAPALQRLVVDGLGELRQRVVAGQKPEPLSSGY